MGIPTHNYTEKFNPLLPQWRIYESDNWFISDLHKNMTHILYQRIIHIP